MRNSLFPAPDVNQYLSEFHQEMLSLNAQKVFCTVSYLLRDRKQESIWLTDAEVSRRARVLIQFIGPAQSELARVGLLHMEPGLNQVKYELITEDEAGT
jgi:hypothetical protein